MGSFPDCAQALWACRMHEKGPLAAIMQLPSADLCCNITCPKVKRGSIACRKDPADKQEWQFSLKKQVSYTEEETKQGYKGESNTKAEAAQWLELKAQGLLEVGDQSPNQKKANRALEDVMPKAGKKTALAIEDGRASGDEEESEACSTKGKDGQVVEAEVLSEVGKSVHKKEAGLRVGRMVKLVKEVKKNLGKAWMLPWLVWTSFRSKATRSRWRMPNPPFLMLPSKLRRPRRPECDSVPRSCQRAFH